MSIDAIRAAWLSLLGAILPVVCLAAAPETRVITPGLSSPAEILIDHWGVPHIYASTTRDAFFAQGWNAARDRLWQIDLWRRSGLGELAEAFGPDYVAQDRAVRLLVYRGDMEKEWGSYGADARDRTAAFVAGINAYVAATRADRSLLPVEFKLAGYLPSFWQAADVVRVRYGLAGNSFGEVARAQIACQTGSLKAAELIYPISPPWTPVMPDGLDLCSIPNDVLDDYRLAQKPLQLGGKELLAASNTTLDSQIQGSNNWVVAPGKSQTGRPILANDPHRALGEPSLRYIAHLVAPGLNVIGAGEPELPGIYIGHNERIAFGITVFFIAQEDLYVYETNPENPNEYRYCGTWEPMRVVHERVAVRGGDAREVELKFTRHGPVLREDPVHHRAYALRAAWLDTGAAPYFGAMGYLQAHDLAQFDRALQHWGGPGENQIYADTSGKIGWLPAGFTPIRANSDGLLPLPGDGRYEWDGYLGRDQLPTLVDPASGFINTSNQMALPADYPYAQRRVGFSWFDDNRFRRVAEVLQAQSKVSLQSSAALQSDDLNQQALRVVKVLTAIQTTDAELQDTIQWLERWNGRVTVASPQAALYEVWSAHHLVSRVLGAVVPALPESMRGAGELGVSEAVIRLLEHPDQRLGPTPNATRDELMLRSLAAALEETRQRLGPDRSSWQWGRLSTILFEHPLARLADSDLRRKLNVGPAAKAGDGGVVGMAAYRLQDFRTENGASFRMVLDVGHWDDSLAVNTPGQSGDPGSEHYRDLFPLWLEGKYFPLVYSRAAVVRATERKIVLQPR